MTIGDFLLERRLAQRKTLQAVSDLTGYSRVYIWEIEQGKKKPSIEALEKISKSLGIEDEKPFLDYAADRIIEMNFLSVKKRKALITVLYKEES